MTISIAELADVISNFNIGTSQNFQVDLSVCGWSYTEALSKALGDDYLIVASCDYRLIMTVNNVFITIHYDRLHAVDVADVNICVKWFDNDCDAMDFYYGIQ